MSVHSKINISFVFANPRKKINDCMINVRHQKEMPVSSSAVYVIVLAEFYTSFANAKINVHYKLVTIYTEKEKNE